MNNFGQRGSSPLTRGKPTPTTGKTVRDRLIPAHAGKTGHVAHGYYSFGAHPRSRGENSSRRIRPLRARWLIPAHAGKTRRSGGRSSRRSAHPRSRGENLGIHAYDAQGKGSSPLTRGKHDDGEADHIGFGLIPAHAGKTRPWPRPTQPTRAHPRSRGENQNGEDTTLPKKGSSPLTRGKQDRGDSRVIRGGLIPAHAGKTTTMPAGMVDVGAHPRSRGENPTDATTNLAAGGSSPLTRGKRLDACPHAVNEGLIPAHAGKTHERTCVMANNEAHPRSRGENREAGDKHIGPSGSSPLTRGKRVSHFDFFFRSGLIPAHAGKTTKTNHGSINKRAHPRSRGENKVIGQGYSGAWGSSPLTRGKPGELARRVGDAGLIPAHAGKTL